MRTRSFAELVDRAWRIAAVMRDELGLESGDHGAMLMSNRLEFVEVMLGALLGGIDVAPINWHLTPDEVAYIVEDCHAKVVFTDPSLLEIAQAAEPSCPLLVADSSLEDAVGSASATRRSLDERAGGPMLYTSGTTGRPKGVVRPTSVSIAEQLQVSADSGSGLGMTGNGPHLVTGPMYHGSPYGFASMEINNGGSILIMPRFDASQCLQTIMERRVCTTHLVPVMMSRLLALPDEERAAFNPSSLDCVLHGAAPVSVPVKQRMIDWWGPRFVEYWGSSEGGAYCMSTSEDWLSHPGSVGKPVESYEVFAVDDDGKRLDVGEVGLLYCRNKNSDAPFEYWNAPEKTQDAYMEPGTFTNGDVGYIDPDGYVYLSDRAADMINSGGVNIYPAEIEAVLIEHPAIADVAVFGIPDDEWGESVKAAVELAPGTTQTPELEGQILDWARERMGGYKVPRSIDFETELPRQLTGKLRKNALRERYWQGRERRI